MSWYKRSLSVGEEDVLKRNLHTIVESLIDTVNDLKTSQGVNINPKQDESIQKRSNTIASPRKIAAFKWKKLQKSRLFFGTKKQGFLGQASSAKKKPSTLVADNVPLNSAEFASEVPIVDNKNVKPSYDKQNVPAKPKRTKTLKVKSEDFSTVDKQNK